MVPICSKFDAWFMVQVSKTWTSEPW